MLSLPEQILESAQNCARSCADYLQKVSAAIIEQKISDYPIFILHRQAYLPVGKTIISTEQHATDWSINASFLEEFSRRQLLNPPRLAQFKQTYKSPQTHLCLFIIFGDAEANFAFLPCHEHSPHDETETPL